ncbi:hypothetical protein [Lentzea sp. NPDC060358]
MLVEVVAVAHWPGENTKFRATLARMRSRNSSLALREISKIDAPARSSR